MSNFSSDKFIPTNVIEHFTCTFCTYFIIELTRITFGINVSMELPYFLGTIQHVEINFPQFHQRQDYDVIATFLYRQNIGCDRTDVALSSLLITVIKFESYGDANVYL